MSNPWPPQPPMVPPAGVGYQPTPAIPMAPAVQIFVGRDQQKFGPYSPADAQARLARGELSHSDLGWYEGLGDWVPLPQALASLAPGTFGAMQYGSAQPGLPKSGLATASFVLSLLGAVGWVIIFAGAIAIASTGSKGSKGELVLIGLVAIGVMMGNVLGAVLGISALPKSIRNKWAAVTGVVINGLELIGMIGLLVLGSMK